MQGFLNWVVLIFPDLGGFLYSKRSGRVGRLLNEYKQLYFFLPLQPKATPLKRRRKGELSHVVNLLA